MRFSLAVATFAPVLAASAADILVQVGAGGKLAFSPSNITANVGDVIAFQFQGKNHSVTQSTFANPCGIMTTPAQGIDSGFQFVPANATELPEWSFTVDNATTPLWFFCAQTNPANHCNAGMVFSVNAKEDGPKNFAAYQAAAMSGNAGAPAGGASAGGASGTPAAGGAVAGATAAAGSVINGITAGAGSAAGAAATDAANAISGAAAGITGLAAGLTGGNAAPSGAPGNGTNPSAGARTSASAVSLFAVVGLAAGMLL